MRRLLPVLVACAVLLTSLSLGAARGQVLWDGRIVLCSGSAVTIPAQDVPGHPGHAALCPDMALSLMAAVAAPAMAVPVAPRRVQILVFVPHTAAETQLPRPRQGRGPPMRLA